MSTPLQLLNEMRALQQHYADEAARKLHLVAEMERRTDGVWLDATRAQLVPGAVYFCRVRWGNGGTSSATLRRWTSAGWVTVYGNEYVLAETDRLQVLISYEPKAPVSSRRRPQGGGA